MKQTKLIIAISVFLQLNLSLRAQNTNNYVEYYNLINEAEALYAQNLHDSCLSVYQKAFSKVDYVHNENLVNASKVCKKLGQKKQAKTYLERVKLQESSINQSHKKYLDSLQKRDQKIRTPKFVKARNYYYGSFFDCKFVPTEKKYAKAEILMKEWWTTDSMNIESVKKFITEYGFPGEKMVGAMTNDNVSIIILHYDKDTSNHVMGETLQTALHEGNITPRMYAWIIDRHLHHAGKVQIYHTLPFFIPNLSEEEREIINSNRESIGLKKLDRMIITTRKNSITVKYK
jgi:tetratricopeptide (TPR) repeat protein